jgi:pSer/pThr/pTyr-binding forkhead associated (FHA) protein
MNDEDVEKITQPPPGAFFIIDGKRYFSLNRKVIKIGRRLDNHLILEDRHVSRSHAQLEVVEGRYVITDLDSTAGTRVNARLITRHILNPGDVVSIATVQMIYGEDPGGPPDDTSQYKPPPSADDERDQVTPLNLFRSIDKPTAPYNQSR